MAEYQKVELTNLEDQLFENQWDKFLTTHFKAREVIDVFQDHKDIIKEAARVAKYQLESTFGGVNAETNQFGWMPILPNFLRATSTPAYSTATWVQDITTANVVSRWIDWIGSSSTNLKLTKYGTMIIVGFSDPQVNVELGAMPRIGAVLAKIKGKDYPIWDFGESMIYSDYPIYELVEPVIVEKEQEIYLQQRADRAGRTELHPVGLFFAKGDYMRNKNAYAQI